MRLVFIPDAFNVLDVKYAEEHVLDVSLLYKTSSFHVAVRLFSNRSQMTSKCGENTSDTPA